MTAPTRRSMLVTALFARGAVARVLAGLLLVLQGFVTGAVPVLDGRADHSEKIVIHVEDAQEQNCPASHDAEDCQLCQAFSSLRGVPANAGAEGRPELVRVAGAPVDAVQGALSLVFLSGNASRAPPTI